MQNPGSIYWLLDNGQGNFLDDDYEAPGKQSPVLPEGEILNEGIFTRKVVQRIAERCQSAGLRYRILVPSYADIPNRKRAAIANQFYEDHPESVLVSVRLNKNQKNPSQGFSSAHGISASYYKKSHKFWFLKTENSQEKMSKNLARVFLRAIESFTGMHNRGVKRSKHMLLRKLLMPAIITRCGYIDHLEDCRQLMNQAFVERVADAHFEAIQFIEGQIPEQPQRSNLRNLFNRSSAVASRISRVPEFLKTGTK